jgi:cell division protein FtsL
LVSHRHKYLIIFSIAFIIKVEQKQQVLLSKRRQLATVEKVCNVIIIGLILVQVVLAGITIVQFITKSLNPRIKDTDCTGD